VPFRSCFIGLSFAFSVAAQAAQATLTPPTPLTLVNPYPGSGAADITGIPVMSKALRAMQTYATPSTTDALVQHLRRVLVAGLEADVEVLRNPRGGGDAAAMGVAAATDPLLLFAGSGLTADATLATMDGLQPVALVAQVPQVLVMYSNGGVADIAQLMQRSLRLSGPLQIATSGERTAGRWLVNQLQGHWPQGLSAVTYNGGNGALRGVLARQVPAALAPLPAILPYANNRNVRVLAIAAGMRHVLLPAVPTFAQAGWPGATASGWHGLFAPPAMPASLVMRLHSALATALRSKNEQMEWAVLGYIAAYGDAAVLRQALRDEQHWTSGNAATARSQDSSGGFTARNIFSSVRS
jgi:tripartite-type tricarboxylate transporter receptor subunit TctC